MSKVHASLAVPLLGLLLVVPASGAGPAQRSRQAPGMAALGPTFEIVSCSLGCASSQSQISCATTAIHENEELRVTFNQPVDPASVSNNSFQMTETGTGRTPPASFALDPLDPNTIVYRPQLTFDSAGNPLFGLIPGRTYLLKLPGTTLDPLGPYVTSIDGVPNRTRMLCTLVASLGVQDVVPGRPLAKIYVRVVVERDPVTGQPTRFARVPAEGATEVWRRGPVEILFADLMNPATVANPVTGTSTAIRFFFDPDGNVMDRSDQVPVPGTFTLTLDQNRETTHAIFQATGGFPASGPRRVPARVVVELSPQMQDLAGNLLLNPGTTSFTTEAR